MSMKCQQSKQINKFNHKNITFDPFECGEHFVEMDYIPCHAIASGVFGTAASVFGKFISHTDQLTEKSTSDSNDEELMLRWSLKVVCIALMVICNVFVWTFFVKALHQRGGSIIATVTSTATNYCGSAIVGNWIFGEEISALWWLGTSFVIIGLVFISFGNTTDKDLKPSKQD